MATSIRDMKPFLVVLGPEGPEEKRKGPGFGKRMCSVPLNLRPREESPAQGRRGKFVGGGLSRRSGCRESQARRKARFEENVERCSPSHCRCNALPSSRPIPTGTSTCRTAFPESTTLGFAEGSPMVFLTPWQDGVRVRERERERERERVRGRETFKNSRASEREDASELVAWSLALEPLSP